MSIALGSLCLYGGNRKTFLYQRWQFLHQNNCSKCQTLERVFAEPKTKEEWRICVSRMIQKSPAWITPDEGEQILAEILGTKDGIIGFFPRKKKYGDARYCLWTGVRCVILLTEFFWQIRQGRNGRKP